MDTVNGGTSIGMGLVPGGNQMILIHMNIASIIIESIFHIFRTPLISYYHCTCIHLSYLPFALSFDLLLWLYSDTI